MHEPLGAGEKSRLCDTESALRLFTAVGREKQKGDISLTRVTKSYLLALRTTQISSFFTKHRNKFQTNQTGNYPVTCLVYNMKRMGGKMYQILQLRVLFLTPRYSVLSIAIFLFPSHLFVRAKRVSK